MDVASNLVIAYARTGQREQAEALDPKRVGSLC